MISIYEKKNVITNNNGEAEDIELRGLSTDDKPTTIDDKDIANGAMFIEIDTGKVYLFDAVSKTWKEV